MTTAVCALLLLRAAPSPPDSLPVQADSAAVETAAPDTVRRINVPRHSGAPILDRDTARIATRTSKYFHPYRSVAGVFSEAPGMWLADQSSEGQYSAFRPRGADWRWTALMRDGRPMGDPATGVTNIWHVPPEEGEMLQLLTGPRAFLAGAPGGALIVSTPMENSNIPVSRITYAESGFEYTRTDGSFAQNVSRHVNVSGGFQALGTDGRFANSAHEQWNARGRVRYSASDRLHAAFSYHFLSAQTGLNGGVNLAASGSVFAFDPLRATVVNPDAYEKLTRADMELRVFGTPLPDSTTLSVLTLYYRRQLREYRDEENRTTPNGLFVQDDHVTSVIGGSARQELELAGARVSAGGSLEIRQVEGSPAMGRRRNSAGAAWGLVDIPLGGVFSTAGFLRYDGFRGQGWTGYGADITARPLPGLTLAAGWSSASRPATYQELFWTAPDVGRNALPSAERHVQAELRADLQAAEIGGLRAATFTRTVTDPILIAPGDSTRVFPSLVFTSGPRRTMRGIETGGWFRIWIFEMDAAALYLDHREEGGGAVDDLPAWSGSAGVFVRGRFLDEALDLKAGVRGRYRSAHAGLRFNPEVQAYVPHAGPDLPAAGWVDLQIFAHIGDAHIHFLWENISDVRAMDTPYYPLLPRQISFGVAWEFLN
jgi:outer membrane cobalamin receptor